VLKTGPSIERVGGVTYPGPTTFGGSASPPSMKNINYTRMHHFKKKNLKLVFPEGLRENVFLGFAVALDGPADVRQV